MSIHGSTPFALAFSAIVVLLPGGGFNGHHCAELQITMDPSLPPADKSWMSLPQNEFPKAPQPGPAPAPGGRGN